MGLAVGIAEELTVVTAVGLKAGSEVSIAMGLAVSRWTGRLWQSV